VDQITGNFRFPITDYGKSSGKKGVSALRDAACFSFIMFKFNVLYEFVVLVWANVCVVCMKHIIFVVCVKRILTHDQVLLVPGQSFMPNKEVTQYPLPKLNFRISNFRIFENRNLNCQITMLARPQF